MQILILIYLLIEAINILFTSRFGFSHPMDRPLAYTTVRKVLVGVRYLIVLIILFLSLSSNILPGLIFLLLPFAIDKIIFKYCKNREKQRLIRLYTSKENSPKPMSQKEAEDVANTMIEMHIKNKEYSF